MGLVSEILGDEELEAQIGSLDLIPATGGKFEVIINDELIFSKKSLGRHAEPGEVYELVKAKAE